MPSAERLSDMMFRLKSALPHNRIEVTAVESTKTITTVEHVGYVFEYDATKKPEKSALKMLTLRKAKKIGWADHRNSNYKTIPSILTGNRLDKRYTVKLVPEEHLEKEVREQLEMEAMIDVGMEDVPNLLS